MKKLLKKSAAYVLVSALALSAAVMADASSSYAKIKLNKRSKTLSVGKSFTLKVKGTKKKAKFSSSKSYVASVSKKGVVKAKSAGKTTITAKIGKKKYKCKVTVKDNSSKKGTSSGSGSGTSNTSKPSSSNSNTNQISNSTLAANMVLKGEVLPADRSVLMVVTNNNNVMVKYAQIRYTLRDTNGKVMTTGSESCYVIKAKQNMLFSIDARDANDNSRIVDMSKSTFSILVNNSFDYKSTDAVTVKGAKNDEKIALTYHNAGNTAVSTYVLICFFNEAGKVIGSTWSFETTSPGSESYDEVNIPVYDYSKPTVDEYGNTAYSDFTFATCKIYKYSHC